MLYIILPCLFCLLVALFVSDLENKTLPNIYVFGVFVLGLIFIFLTPTIAASSRLVMSGIIALLLLLISGTFTLINKKSPGLGAGDIKLFAALSLWLSPDHVLFFAACSFAVFSIYGALKGVKPEEKVALGPFIIPCFAMFMAIPFIQ